MLTLHRFFMLTAVALMVAILSSNSMIHAQAPPVASGELLGIKTTRPGPNAYDYEIQGKVINQPYPAGTTVVHIDFMYFERQAGNVSALVATNGIDVILANPGAAGVFTILLQKVVVTPPPAAGKTYYVKWNMKYSQAPVNRSPVFGPPTAWFTSPDTLFMP